MSIRGTAIATSTVTTSTTVSLTTLDVPGGGTATAVAGDTAYVFVCAAYGITALSGWSTVFSDNLSTWNFYAATKTLSSGDISTGSITANYGGGFDAVICVVVNVGAVTQVEFQQDNDGGTSGKNLTCTSAVTNTSIGLYWASARGTSNTSITVGAGSATLLETGTTTNALARFWIQNMPGGAQTNLFHADGTVGRMMQVFVSGGGSSSGILIPAGLDGLGNRGQLKGGING